MKNKEIIQIINKAASQKWDKLDLSNKELRELPPEIGQLYNLKSLDLSNNQLSNLPPQIDQLRALETLRIFRNQFSEIPSIICSLTNLEELGFGDNFLKSMPPEIKKLKKLRELRLWQNQLTAIPPEIGELQNLRLLHLKKNNISRIPAQIRQLENLVKLILTDNPLPIPPEILEKIENPKSIITFYLEHQNSQKKPLNEAKVLLVGQGEVGKTSLVRRLVEDKFDRFEKKTEGINITTWNVIARDNEIRLNIWDFGGQEIMHATHQFFLTRRSLYLLVLDCRIGEEENRIEYWLKIIQGFGGDSPIIIVGNKIDEHPLDINQSGLQGKYPSIKAFIKTSCLKNIGSDELKSVIVDVVDKLPHIHDELNFNWLAVKTQLENMQRDYIPYAEYAAMCQAENITDDASQRTLISFLHDIGTVLNFQDDLRLVDTNILNPQWVTHGVYQILNSPILFSSRGVLDGHQLCNILDSKKYPLEKHIFIINMMRRFELCFPFDTPNSERYLIPDLLEKEKRYTGNWEGALEFQYHYNVLPSSIFSRFVVRMHPYIHENTYWRLGVLLAHENNEGLVRADIADRKIFISIRGPKESRRDFLSKIRFQIDLIHKTIPSIEVQEKVPIPNHPELPPVDYKYLLTLERKNVATHIFEGMSNQISVQDLLDGVEPEQDRLIRYYGKILTSDKLAQIQKQAQNAVRFKLGFILGMAMLFYTILAFLVYRNVVSWDAMEPITYFLTVMGTVFSYIYFLVRLREWNPIEIYRHYLENERRRKVFSELEKEYETRSDV